MQHDSMPLVSVYLTTRNRLKLLKRAINSVLNQTYQNIELIVVDDASNDGTRDYLRELSSTNGKVKAIFNENNLGACVGRNRAIAASNGEFVTGLDDDDYFKENRIESFLKKWDAKNPQSVAIYSNSILIKGNKSAKTINRPATTTHEDLLDTNYIGNQIFCRKKTFIDFGGFDEKIPAWQDLEHWYRILKQSRCRAELDATASYIIDMSHPHERISTQKIERIRKAFEYFSLKHKLSKTESSILSLQLCFYDLTAPSTLSILLKLRRKLNLRTLRQSITLIARPFSNKLFTFSRRDHSGN